ncbi:MAG: metallopeptidase TldD-related protein [Ignavibacteria bacterium]|nr:metallopeptidase TldD-related protein [Ignavibacteria bacterium]
MKNRIIKYCLLIFLFAHFAYSADENVIISALKKEIERFTKELSSEQYPPYYIGYQVTEVQSAGVTSVFGRTSSKGTSFSRFLDIDLRVGNYQLDNTHRTEGSFLTRSSFSFRQLPIEHDELAIRAAVWNATEQVYKEAVKQYRNVLTSRAVKVKEEDTSADFSIEIPSKYFEKRNFYNVDLDKWERILNNVSKIFSDNKWLLEAHISFSFKNDYKIFVNSEGSEISQNQPQFRIVAFARTKAEDGMVLYLNRTFFSFSEEGLPDESTLRKAILDLVSSLKALKDAPLMDTYSGPAILAGEAAGVFFHEIFGHRVEGHRMKDPREAQTFKSFINKRVLPDFINVVFDPTRMKLNGLDLSGYYKYDDEGVEASSVVSVDSGIFRRFLMSRSPIEGFKNSNGHGRKQVGFRAVSRQSNLIVESRRQVSLPKLREMLIEECKRQGKEYGLLFVEVEGGFTFTGRTIPNAFNVLPLIVYKVYVDGRPDELVRGVDLIGTPLTTFANVVATGDDMGIFNGICGAESGGVPVSACSPSLLVSLIEVQKKAKSEEKPPILSSP